MMIFVGFGVIFLLFFYFWRKNCSDLPHSKEIAAIYAIATCSNANIESLFFEMRRSLTKYRIYPKSEKSVCCSKFEN